MKSEEENIKLKKEIEYLKEQNRRLLFILGIERMPFLVENTFLKKKIEFK